MKLPSAQRNAFLLALPILVAAAGCRSSGTQSNSLEPDREIKPIGALVEATKKPESIGKLLADLNSSIKAWNNLSLAAQTPKDQARGREIELHIQTVAHQRRAEIVNELQSGPLNNRIVAAAALGFTREPEAQGPLLVALDDPHPEVVSSALVGLWLLQRADTPIEKICPFLASEQDDNVRSNAALLVAWLTEHGSKGSCELPAARMGLLDKSPTVRTHSALIIANRLDADSMQALIDRLDDDTSLVCAAAVRAITYIGKNVPQAKGAAARGLVKAWVSVKDDARQAVMFRGLVDLAQSNYGSDEKEWIKWAERLP
jgi:hypothetical protein